MDIIKLTRDLGAAIQQDERYLKFHEAKAKCDSDEELSELFSKIQLIQMNFQMEAQKGDDADNEKLEAFNNEFEEAYGKFMSNEKMVAFEQTRGGISELMEYIMQILSLCADGADPYTCEPPKQEDHDCGGQCSSCSGCH